MRLIYGVGGDYSWMLVSDLNGGVMTIALVENSNESRLLKERFDKNTASDYVSRRLGRSVSGEAMRQLHVRRTCPSTGKFEDGRLYWERYILDEYIRRCQPISIRR